MYIFEIFRSKYCIAVAIISLIIGYLILPNNIFSNPEILINSILFIVLFSLSLTCTIRNIKDRIVISKSSSILSIIATIIGFTAIQTCLVSGFCGVNLVLSILATIFPTIILNVFTKYGLYVLILSNMILAFSLYNMKCFKNMNSIKFIRN